MRRIGQLAGGVLVTVAAVAAGAGPVAADPAEGLVVESVCDDGNTYTTIARAGQTWNAQLITDSSSVFHLTRYDMTFVVTAPDGTVTAYPPQEVEKGGSGREHKELLTCTYAFEIEFADGSTAHVSGASTGWVTPSSGG